MSLRYCFESSYVSKTLSACKRADLAVVDTEGHEETVNEAVKRGVWVYGYLNIGALEKERSYYSKYKHLMLARYDGWSGEYWIDPTAKGLCQTLWNAPDVITAYIMIADEQLDAVEGYKEYIHHAPAPEPEMETMEEVAE